MGITSKVERIAPEAAKKMLSIGNGSITNRSVKPTHVEWLASQIQSGKWICNGEPIIIGESGRVLDGQHRLLAIEMCGKEVESVVTRGVDEKAFSTIDTGIARKASDVLHMRGEAAATVLASALGFLFRYEKSALLNPAKSAGFTSESCVNLLKKHPNIRQSVSWAAAMRRSAIGNVVPPSPFAFLHYMLSSYNATKAAEFFDKVFMVQNDTKTSPTRILRERLLSQWRRKPPAIEQLAIAVKAWRAFLDNESVTTLKWSRFGKTSESFPVFPGDTESKGQAIKRTMMKNKINRTT